MIIKILGSGCPNCEKLEMHSKLAAQELELDFAIEKITDIMLIVGYGVMSTPALVVNEQVIVYGKVPSVEEIKEIFSSISKN